MGNVVPVGLGLAVGLVLWPLGILVQAIAFIFWAWIGIGIWGFYDNQKIDQEIRGICGAEGELVGFVFTRLSPALDLHAEIGLMRILDDGLEIVGELEPVIIHKNEIVEISRKVNLHAIVLLGGWIAIELLDGRELRFESRKFSTMFKSSVRTRAVFQELKTWKQEKAPA